MPLQFASFVLALFIGAAPVVPAPVTTQAPRLARLDVSVVTSAPTTVVRLWPGAVLARRVVSNTGGLQIQADPTGWTIRGGRRGASVRLSAVFEDASDASRLTLRLRTIGSGKARLRIRNVSSSAFNVADATLAGAGVRSLSLSRTRVFGRVAPKAGSADERKLVLAAYYPWYGSNYGNPMLSDRPSDPRNTRDADDVLAMTRQANAAGIDGFVTAWTGAERSGPGLDLVLDAARRTGSVASVYLETQAANAEIRQGLPARPAVMLRWIEQALQRSSDPAFLTSGGVPVMFVFRMNALRPAGWTWIHEQLRARGRRVRLVGDAGLNGYDAQSWGYHRYVPNNGEARMLSAWNRGASADAKLLSSPSRLFVATVSPGYDDRPSRGTSGNYIPRGAAGERYAATWDAVFASEADWVLVTSWNEWFEGTAIEPSVGAGEVALRQTASYAARFKG